VLAGHSLGGLYVQTFAATYPDQVAGLLLDSTAPKPGPALPVRTASYDVLGRVPAVFSVVAHFGAGRLIAQAYRSLPPHVRGEAPANASTGRFLRRWIEESFAASTSMQQAASLTNLDDEPLVVVTADTGNAAGWEQAQDRMAALSANSSHRVAKDTTHASLLHDEAGSAAASQAFTTSCGRCAPVRRWCRSDAVLATRHGTDGDDREQFHAAAAIVVAAGGACLAAAIGPNLIT
jgi:pimeloyl-ACP methyl ester carboxylesterase